jgi:hypothetical protein
VTIHVAQSCEIAGTQSRLSLGQKARVAAIAVAVLFIVHSHLQHHRDTVLFKYRFADATWMLVRESIEECGDDQKCHQAFLSQRLDKIELPDVDRKKVELATKYVISGEADKRESAFVETNLGSRLHTRLRGEPAVLSID